MLNRLRHPQEMRKENARGLQELKEAQQRNLLTLWAGLEQLRREPCEELPARTHEAMRPLLMSEVGVQEE